MLDVIFCKMYLANIAINILDIFALTIHFSFSKQQNLVMQSLSVGKWLLVCSSADLNFGRLTAAPT